jgi:ribonucleoside-diphosphate reductase alpha chain
MPTIWNQTKKPRPRSLTGYTYHIDTPVGKSFITINENGGNQPFEVFLNTAKAGSETAAVSEAIGRLISYLLRLASPIAPRKRLYEIYRQMKGIGGSRTYGYGPNRVSSLPDGVAQVLGEYLDQTAKDGEMPITQPSPGNGKSHTETPINIQKVGDICPECGQASVVNEEGCRKCYSCSYSEC